LKNAIISYNNSNNLGDYIQSIAAKNFFKKEPILIDRESLVNYNYKKVKIIMNGWFMENPENWPPSDKIIPLFISFHINPTAEKKILTKKGINYLRKFEPIGCRDNYTKKLLNKVNIKAYFTGCLTLTLNKKKYINKSIKNDVLIISVFERLLPSSINYEINFKLILNLIKIPFKYFLYKKGMRNILKNISSNRNVKHISQIIKKKESINEKYILAENQLKEIANSNLVITSRIHSALPAIAFGVPVVFLNDGLDHINHFSRIDGLNLFFKSINSSELSNIDIKKIIPKKKHLDFSNLMSEKIKNFINK
tara:strand:+ start:3565 stop:4491 length:927 start_codon:yes stop_codon:yes gene_type:complete